VGFEDSTFFLVLLIWNGWYNDIQWTSISARISAGFSFELFLEAQSKGVPRCLTRFWARDLPRLHGYLA